MIISASLWMIVEFVMRRLGLRKLTLRLPFEYCTRSASGSQLGRKETIHLSRLPQMSAMDEKLVRRGEFHGIKSDTEGFGKKLPQPELSLSRLHEFLSSNYRVSGDLFMTDVLLRLEKGDDALVSLLTRSGDRWLPLLVSSTGLPLSNVPIEGRRIIMKRLWEQMERFDLPMSTTTFNSYMKVLIENDVNWNAWTLLKELEEARKLEPDQDTFRILMRKLALKGDTDGCNRMVYEMARRGFVIDYLCHSSLVYAATIRGMDEKAESLIQQSLTQFGEKGEVESLSAAAVAAAAAGRMNSLRKMLRRSVDSSLLLRLPHEAIFDIIWHLCEKGEDKGKSQGAFVEEILARCQHSFGFFRYLFREIERHIAANHFHMSILLLGETMRVKHSLKTQERQLFALQLVSRMCKGMVRSKMPLSTMKEMANRMETTLPLDSRFAYDELLFSSLLFKESDEDSRFEALSGLVPIVDATKERTHLILPIIVHCPTLDDRLKILFRFSALGYTNLHELDNDIMVQFILQPLYSRNLQRKRKGNLLKDLSNVLTSFGISKKTQWNWMHGWWNRKKEDEKGLSFNERVLPSATEIQTWLQEEYAGTFTRGVDKDEKKNEKKFTADKLRALLDKEDTTSLSSLLSTNGWPQDANLSSMAVPILNLYLNKEKSSVVMKLIQNLSTEWNRRNCQREDDLPLESPLQNTHLLLILNHRIKEERCGLDEVIEYCYELKRLFPHAISSYDNFFDTTYACSRIFNLFLVRKDSLSVAKMNKLVELLKTLMKLELITLNPNETLTPAIVKSALLRHGWAQGVNTWLSLHSSISCPNGLVALLSHATSNLLNVHDEHEKEEMSVNHILHKAHSCMPSSRVHALYSAVLTNFRQIQEAHRYLSQYGFEISPHDCVQAFRFMNNYQYPSFDKSLFSNYPRLCLQYTKLAQDTEEAKTFLSVALRLCIGKRAGPSAVEIIAVFKEYGIEIEDKQNTILNGMIEEHKKLMRKWVYAPNGILAMKEDDQILKEDKWKEMIQVGIEKKEGIISVDREARKRQ